METIHKAEIINIKRLSHRVLEFSLKPENAILFAPGQFIVIHHNEIERSYSLSNCSGEPHVEIIVALNDKGVLTPDLFEKRIGDSLDISEAKGDFILPDKLEQDLCFICTGTGIGPFKSMIETIYKSKIQSPNIYLVFGNRKEEDILYHQLWKELEKEHPGFSYFPVLSQTNWEGLKGYVHPVYQKIAQSNSNILFYVCGWQNMCVETRRNLKALGFNRRQYKFEQYD